MLRWLLLLLPLAGCSKGPQADLASISAARSLAAEWALVNEQANEGHLIASYTETMRRMVHEQLRTTANSLTQPESPYGREIAALLTQPADAAPSKLRAHAAKLRQIEDSIESA